MKKIFIINGSGGVGKDTFVELVSQFFPVVNVSSVHKVKEIAIEIKNLTKEYKMYPRKKDRLIETIFPSIKRHSTFKNVTRFKTINIYTKIS